MSYQITMTENPKNKDCLFTFLLIVMCLGTGIYAAAGAICICAGVYDDIAITEFRTITIQSIYPANSVAAEVLDTNGNTYRVTSMQSILQIKPGQTYIVEVRKFDASQSLGLRTMPEIERIVPTTEEVSR